MRATEQSLPGARTVRLAHTYEPHEPTGAHWAAMLHERARWADAHPDYTILNVELDCWSSAPPPAVVGAQRLVYEIVTGVPFNVSARVTYEVEPPGGLLDVAPEVEL